MKYLIFVLFFAACGSDTDETCFNLEYVPGVICDYPDHNVLFQSVECKSLYVVSHRAELRDQLLTEGSCKIE